jgi:hypothetical protein
MINVVGGDRMSRKLSIIFVCIVCFGGIAQAAAPPLWNGNFSAGLEGWWTWTPNSAAQSVTVVDGAAVIYNNDQSMAGSAKLGQGWLDAVPGGNYTVTFDFKATNVATGDGWAGEGVGVEFYDAGGNWLATPWMNLWDTTSYTPDWVPQTLAATAPAGAAHVQVVFHTWTGFADVGTGTATMWVDNVTMAPEPATMILLGIGGLVTLRRKHA